jgi:hypothetical protein
MAGFNKYNLNGLEMTAQYEADQTANVKITFKPNVNWLRVVYNGGGNFSYYLDGKGGKVREVNRDFAHDVLIDEVKLLNKGN